MRTLAILLITLSICAAALSSETDNSAAEKGIFSGTFADALWTVAAFMVLLLVLRKFAWKPLLNTLKNREEHIKQQLDAADNARRQAQVMLDDSKQQGLQIIEQAAQQAHQQQNAIIEKATQQAVAVKHKTQADIEYAQLAASQQLWQYAGDMLLSVSTEILGRAITHEDNQRLICEAIEKLKQDQAGSQV